MRTITVDLPEEVLDNFTNVDELRKAIYEDFIVAQRQQGHISLGRAAELLGLNYIEFFDLLGRKGLSFTNATKTELEESQQEFDRLLEKHSR
jgi:predicted HTH domain antitoxin